MHAQHVSKSIRVYSIWNYGIGPQSLAYALVNVCSSQLYSYTGGTTRISERVCRNTRVKSRLYLTSMGHMKGEWVSH